MGSLSTVADESSCSERRRGVFPPPPPYKPSRSLRGSPGVFSLAPRLAWRVGGTRRGHAVPRAACREGRSGVSPWRGLSGGFVGGCRNEARHCRSEGSFSGRGESRLFSESTLQSGVSPPPPPDKPSRSLRGSLGLSGGFGGCGNRARSCRSEGGLSRSLRGSLGLSGGFGGWERDEALPFRGRLFGTRRGTAVLRVYLIVQSGVYDRIHFILDHVAISLISIEYIFQNCALLCSVFFIACAHHYPQRYTVMHS